jgi:hypothetical protein
MVAGPNKMNMNMLGNSSSKQEFTISNPSIVGSLGNQVNMNKFGGKSGPRSRVTMMADATVSGGPVD